MSRITQNILKIGADNSQFKRVMRESDGLLDKSKGQWRQYGNVLTKELDKVNTQLETMLKNAKSMDDIKGIRSLTNQAKELRREIENINKMGGGSGGGAAGAGMMAAGGRGMLGMIASFLPALAPILIGSRAYGAASSLSGPGTKLAGLVGTSGLQTVKAGRGRAARLGFGPTEQAQAAIQLAQQTGGVGGLEDVLAMSKGFGIDTGTLVGAAGGFRRAGMSQAQSVKSLSDAIGVAVASKIDRSRVGEFLQVTANMVEEMASQGISVDPNDIARMAGSLAGASEFLRARPQAVQAGLGAVASLLQQGSGARFGFAAQALQRASGGQLGGSSLLYELSLGLGRGNKDKGGLQGFFTPEERFKAIYKGVSDITNRPGISQAGRAITAGQILGMEPAAADRFMKTMEKNATLTEEQIKQIEKEFSKATKSAETNALEVMDKTLEGNFQKLIAEIELTNVRLGETLAPTVNEIREGIRKLVDGVTGIANIFGVGEGGLITRGTKAVSKGIGLFTKSPEKEAADLAMYRLREDASPMSNRDRESLETSIRGTLGGFRGGKKRKELRTELEEKLAAIGPNDEATRENTQALLLLIESIEKQDARIRELKMLSGGRLPGITASGLTVNGTNEIK